MNNSNSENYAMRNPSHRSAKKADEKIEFMCKSIENKIESAARRRENNLNTIKMKIKRENAKRENAYVVKIREVHNNFEAELTSVTAKKPVKNTGGDDDEEPAYGVQTSRDHVLRHGAVSYRPQSALLT